MGRTICCRSRTPAGQRCLRSATYGCLLGSEWLRGDDLERQDDRRARACLSEWRIAAKGGARLLQCSLGESCETASAFDPQTSAVRRRAWASRGGWRRASRATGPLGSPDSRHDAVRQFGRRRDREQVGEYSLRGPLDEDAERSMLKKRETTRGKADRVRPIRGRSNSGAGSEHDFGCLSV